MCTFKFTECVYTLAKTGNFTKVLFDLPEKFHGITNQFIQVFASGLKIVKVFVSLPSFFNFMDLKLKICI